MTVRVVSRLLVVGLFAGISLPAEPDAVVLSLDWTGGLAEAPADDVPALRVLADGTVLARTPRGKGRTAKGKLEREELLALVRFVVTEQRFFEFDPVAIEKQRKAADDGEHPPMVLDAATTVIRVRLADRSHEAAQYALDFVAKEYPGVPGLVRLARVSERLNRLRVVTIAGGPESVARYVRLVNAAAGDEDSGYPPFTAADLDDAWLRPEKGCRVRFRQERPPEEEGGRVHGRLATVVDDGEDEPTVSFHRY